MSIQLTIHPCFLLSSYTNTRPQNSKEMKYNGVTFTIPERYCYNNTNGNDSD